MGKEENLKPAWKKGESGNPAGRPKGAKNRSTIARKWLAVMQKETNVVTNKEEQLSQEDLMTLSLIKKAREGDTAAYKALMDSGYGAPIQEIDQTSTVINQPPITDEEIESIKNKLNEDI